MLKQGGLLIKPESEVLLLTQENTCSLRFHFKLNRENKDSSEKGTTDFQRSHPLYCYKTITRSFGDFKRFHYFNFKTTFLKTKTFFKKLE